MNVLEGVGVEGVGEEKGNTPRLTPKRTKVVGHRSAHIPSIEELATVNERSSHDDV